jgi:ribonucleoside-diphosphate reductase subunit M2
MSKTTTDLLLTSDDNRFVMFPIKCDDIWKMYKKQVDCFWRAEEIDLSKDLTNWDMLNEDEKYFISMILAFFAASDGIVLENLATRFMNDVQLAEARAFYGFQIAMENIHCVTGTTKILTDKGYFAIKNLENTKVNVWNGIEFSNVQVKYTENQDIYKVTLSNGMELDCSPGHKWLIENNNNYEEIKTIDLKIDNILKNYDIPFIEFNNEDEFLNPYLHGFFCGEGIYFNKSQFIYLYDKQKEYFSNFKYDFLENNTNFIDISNYINKEQYIVPINYNKDTRIRWLEGYIDSIGYVDTDTIKIFAINYKFLQDIQLMLTTLGIQTHIRENNNLELKKYTYFLYITENYINKLIDLGFSPKIYKINDYKNLNKNETFNIKIKNIKKIAENKPTYCFNEPKQHKGIFNGILTCQSETYSLLIDSYIKDNEQKNKFFNAIKHFPCIKKKSDWAQKWIHDNRSSFATRLIAFACVEGIFFSGAFCSIYWLKKRGLMPGLTFSNELISRDEALHCEFAILLYSKLNKKIDKVRINEIIKEAVEIEMEFICEALPCKLIGMNSDLMSQYIKFVADRLAVQLGYKKIYNVSNPFQWMELISLDTKSNFFEKRVSEYALATKDKTEDIFILTDDF